MHGVAQAGVKQGRERRRPAMARDTLPLCVEGVSLFEEEANPEGTEPKGLVCKFVEICDPGGGWEWGFGNT